MNMTTRALAFLKSLRETVRPLTASGRENAGQGVPRGSMVELTAAMVDPFTTVAQRHRGKAFFSEPLCLCGESCQSVSWADDERSSRPGRARLPHCGTPAVGGGRRADG